MRRKRNLRKNPETPWLLVAGIVFALSFVDRFGITDQSSFIDRLLDWSTILSAMLGSCYAWVTSYHAPLRSTTEPGPALALRVFGCWLLGPFFVAGAACFANDIDGGLLLFYPPALGILLALFVLPLLMTKRFHRLTKL